MRTLGRGLLATGLVAVAGAGALGLGFGGSFDDIAAIIAGSEDPSALKIQGFIEKESDRLSKDFITFSKVAKEAAKDEYGVLSLEQVQTELDDMISRSGEFGAAAFGRLAEAMGSEPDPRKVARILKKQLLYFAKQARGELKFNEAYEAGDYSKAAVYYAAVQKLFEAVDRAFPPPL